MKIQTAGVVLLASVSAAVLHFEAADAEEVIANTAGCAAIAGLATADFVVERAEIVPTGSAPSAGGNAEPLPEHCLVQGMLNPRLGGFGTLRYYALTPPDPAFDPMTFDFDRDVERTRQTWALGDADATYLETFGRTGKMIVYHGLSDQGMAAGALADWYEQTVADTGESIRDSVRLFFVPGMTHCGGGRATDQFDMLDAIVAWVEEGRAPDSVVATGDAFPGVSRPLCPHPLVARYEGGDEDSADSFVCSE